MRYVHSDVSFIIRSIVHCIAMQWRPLFYFVPRESKLKLVYLPTGSLAGLFFVAMTAPRPFSISCPKSLRAKLARLMQCASYAYLLMYHSNIMHTLFWMMKCTGGYNSDVNFTMVLHRIIPKLKWFVIFCIEMSSTSAQVIAPIFIFIHTYLIHIIYRFHRMKCEKKRANWTLNIWELCC